MIYVIGLGAALGSLIRFKITLKIKKLFKSNWPLATFLINLSGSFLLGLMFGTGLGKNYFLFLGTGVIGGFTTFSTLNSELVGQFNNKHPHTGISYMVFSYMGGFCFFVLGYFITSTNL